MDLIMTQNITEHKMQTLMRFINCKSLSQSSRWDIHMTRVTSFLKYNVLGEKTMMSYRIFEDVEVEDTVIHGYIYSQGSQGCQMSENHFIKKKHVIFRWAGKRGKRGRCHMWESMGLTARGTSNCLGTQCLNYCHLINQMTLRRGGAIRWSVCWMKCAFISTCESTGCLMLMVLMVTHDTILQRFLSANTYCDSVSIVIRYYDFFTIYWRLHYSAISRTVTLFCFH